MCQNPQETSNLATLTEDILNGKFYFLCSELSERLFDSKAKYVEGSFKSYWLA